MASSKGLEVADIVRRFGPAFRAKNHGKLSRAHLRTLGAIETCRTAALGAHLYECADCGARKIVYNSCRNRHCPKCQSLEKERWLEERCAGQSCSRFPTSMWSSPYRKSSILWQ